MVRLYNLTPPPNQQRLSEMFEAPTPPAGRGRPVAPRRTASPRPRNNNQTYAPQSLQSPPTIILQQPLPPVARPATKGQAPPGRRGRPPGPRAWWSRVPSLPKLSGCCGGWVSLFLVWSVSVPGFLATIARFTHSFVTFSNDFGQAVSVVAQSGANVTGAASTVVTSFAYSSLDLVTEAWRGIDLHDLRIVASGTEVWTDDFPSLYQWLNSSVGRSATGWPSQMCEQLFPYVHLLSPHTPQLELTDQVLHAAGRFLQWRVSMLWYPGPWVHLRWELIQADFNVSWANPFWSLLELPTDTEVGQMQDNLRLTFAKIQVVPPDLPGAVPARQHLITFHSWWHHLVNCLGFQYGASFPPSHPYYGSHSEGCHYLGRAILYILGLVLILCILPNTREVIDRYLPHEPASKIHEVVCQHWEALVIRWTQLISYLEARLGQATGDPHP